MRPWAKISFALLLLARSGLAQGFVNMDFEDATVILAGSPDMIEASSALPGWTTYPGVVFYDTVSLGGALVALDDANAINGFIPIQGNYSVFLEGSTLYANTTASIGQTGTIPITAQSLTFFGNLSANILGQHFQVTFNGQNISYFAVGNGANGNGATYTIYGANIASYAGQTGQLLFTAPVQSESIIDNIQFSSSSVPEPSEFALTALGALLLGFRRWRNSF
jgi:hypothetical protein